MSTVKQERATINLADMVSPEVNVRLHPERQIKKLIRNLDKFGQCRDIVLDENNVILAGNGLKEAMERRGDKAATVIRLLGLSEKEKLKFMLADNKTFTLGIEDNDGINAVLAMLGDELDVPGYDENTLKAIVASADEVAEKLMGYGTLNEGQIATIKAAGERMETKEATTIQSTMPTNSAPLPSAPSTPTESVDEQKPIVCPHCGKPLCP